TVHLLAALLQNGVVRLVGAFRATEVPPRRALAALQADLLRHGQLEVLRLAELTPLAAMELFQAEVGEWPISAPLRRHVLRLGAGVPRHLVMLARAIREPAGPGTW